MKRVMQTTFGEYDGNCFAACLASVLEIDIEDVPDLRGSEQWETALAWLWGRRLTAIELNFRPRLQFPNIFASFGLKGTGHAIASGKSPRGDFDHAVVVKVDQNTQKVEFIHDPHPDGGMLRDLDALMFIMPGLLRF